MDKSRGDKAKILLISRYMAVGGGNKKGAGQKDTSLVKRFLTLVSLSLSGQAVLAGGILISSEELANSFIQTFISWRICYGQVAVSQIVLLCFAPPPTNVLLQLQPLHFAFQRARTTQGKHNRESFVTVTRSSNYFPDKT